jgi:phosphoadenosine phosphosulfate reductase
MKDRVDALNRQFLDSVPEDVLSWFVSEFVGKIAFSSSLGAEDQVITRMLAGLKQPVKIFTLDTGRIFQETYDTLDITRKKYDMAIEVYFPDAARVEEMVNSKGINLFYESVENRRLCCHIRKIEPLHRALEGMEVWITGLRQEQSVTRSGASMVEWDASQSILKLNPLIHWSYKTLWQYIRVNNIPVNELHSQGFPSIGCMPCTRAVQPGEDVRAGRWWWELPQNKECGLHKKNLNSQK